MAVQLIATSLLSTVLILMANRGRYSGCKKTSKPYRQQETAFDSVL